MTRTFVRFYGDEDLVEIKAGYEKLASDLERRRPFLSRKVASAIERRLELIRHAWALLLEPIPEDLL